MIITSFAQQAMIIKEKSPNQQEENATAMRQKQYGTALLLFIPFNILDTNKKHLTF